VRTTIELRRPARASVDQQTVITGYNTDVEHNGIVYHVQTEDKGLQTPVILSLVYTGGAILASKRSPYDDLIAGGFDQDVLAERLQRQHKLICAAVHAGRIEELKRMGERATVAPETAPAITPLRDEAQSEHSQEEPASGLPLAEPLATDTPERFSISEETEDALAVNLIDEKQLRAGQSLTLRIQVTQRSGGARVPAAKANITLKILGSTFQPTSTYSTTDGAGLSSISIALPTFKSGRAAILIRAETDGQVAELRRIIHPA
jgi:hypothetical protein